MSEIESYINHSNWRIKQNSNTSFSVSDMEAKIAEKESARWWFSQYPSEIAEAHRVGALYLHNLGRVTTYCMGWDLRALLAKGFGGNPDFLSSAPPHHLRVAFLQMANFLYTVQGEAAGAQAFSNVDTLLAPYIRYENMSDEELEQSIQELVYNLNVPTRASGQPPFLNFQLDIVPPKSLEDQQVMLGDRPYENFTYSDFRQEMNRFNKAFAKVMMKGDGDGKPFSFPIPTYSLPNLKRVDIPEIWEMTAKYGLPYFMMDATSEDAYSMCCHLRLDKKLLMFRSGGIFAKFPLTGSIGVVTISLPAMSAMKGQGSFFDVLSHYMGLARDSLLVKGNILEEFMDKGLYPYSKYWLQDIKGNTGSYFGNHFRTIGLVGMNEACLMETGKGINTDSGRDWAKKVLEFMAQTTNNYTDKTGFLFNLEATPAETAAHYCARGNIKAGMGVKHSGTKETPYYTASSLLPSSFDGGLWAALDNQNELQPLYTGGTVFHIFSEHQFTPKQTEKLIFAIKEKYQLPYITFTPNIRICPEHGWIPDDVQGKCPICGKEIVVYSRPVGYLRPVKGFSDSKQAEFNSRCFFDAGL